MSVDLTQSESKAMDLSIELIATVINLNGRRLVHNNAELSQAIHVIQGFVKQSVVHRADPLFWSDWWEDNV